LRAQHHNDNAHHHDGDRDHARADEHDQHAKAAEHDRYHDHDHDHNHGHDHDHGHAHDLAHEHSHERGGVLGAIGQLLRPHSHDHSDSVDDALEGSAEGIRAVKISLIGLGITAVLQLLVVFFSGSVALLADTIHNFAGASTAIPLWIAFSIGRRAASRRYTYGYGRAEDLAGVFIVLMIAGSAALAGWESLQRLIRPEPIQHLGWVALAGLIGFLGNEIVAQHRIRVGQRIGSAALVADGYHARTDGFTSLAVLLGAGGVWLGFPQADPLVGLGITVAIVLVLKGAVVQVWHRLMDAVDEELLDSAEAAARSAEGVEGVTEVRARWIGHAIHAEALITADCDLTLAQAPAVAERARHEMLHAVPKLASVTVHVDPCGHHGIDHHADLAHHQPGHARTRITQPDVDVRPNRLSASA
jgi:cation diffusion facilitator family transporter